MKLDFLTTIRSHEALKRYFFNTSWLYLTQGVRLFAGFFVGLWLARYMGPEQYGIYNYITSFSFIFISFGVMGVGETLVKKIVENAETQIETLNAGFLIRLIAGFLGFFLLLITLIFLPLESNIVRLILIISPVVITQAFDVIDQFYLAKVMVKESAKWRVTQIILSSLIKVYLILTNASVTAFIWMGLFDAAFYSSVVYIHYRRNFKDFIFLSPQISLVKQLFKDSLPLMVITLSTILFSKMDQLMLGSMLSQYDLGLYSSAIRIVEMMTIFLGLTIQSFFPAIISAKKSNQEQYLYRFVSLSRLLLGGAVVMALGMSFFSKEIMGILYGEQYQSAYQVLALLSFNAIFVGMSLISHRWYIAENLQKVMMMKIIALVGFNIILNLLLIPRYGIMGVAYSSLTSHFIFYFLFELFFKKTRQCFWINALIARSTASKEI